MTLKNTVRIEKGRRHFLVKGLGRLCVFVRRCQGVLSVLECVNLGLMTVIDWTIDSDLYKLSMFNSDMLQIYCNVSNLHAAVWVVTYDIFLYLTVQLFCKLVNYLYFKQEKNILFSD